MLAKEYLQGYEITGFMEDYSSGAVDAPEIKRLLASTQRDHVTRYMHTKIITTEEEGREG